MSPDSLHNLIMTCKDLRELMDRRNAFFALLHSGQLKPGMRFPEEPPPYAIFDVRSPQDFKISSMINSEEHPGSIAVNIDPKFVDFDVTGQQLEDMVCKNTRDMKQKEMFRRRTDKNYEVIVLVDWGSRGTDLSEKHRLVGLMTILSQKDPGISPPKHLILDGGFSKWLEIYPELTTNPGAKAPKGWRPDDLEAPVRLDKHLVEGPAEPPRVLVDMRPSPKSSRPPMAHETRENVVKTLDILRNLVELLRSQKKCEHELVKLLLDVQKIVANESVGVDLSQRIHDIVQLERKIEGRIKSREAELMNIDQKVPWSYEQRIEKANAEEHIKKLKKQIIALKKKQEKITKEITSQHPPKAARQSPHVRGDSDSTQSFSSSLGGPPRRRSLSEPRVSQGQEEDQGSIEGAFFLTPPSQTTSQSRQSSWRDMDKVPGSIAPGTTGLLNKQQYICYANAIVQCLSQTQPVKRYFVNNFEAGGAVTQVFSLVLQNLWSGHFKYFSLEVLKDRVASLRPNFNNRSQQDTHEFLTVLLNILHDELKERTSENEGDVASPQEAMERALEGQTSIISKSFYGQTRAFITCQSCGRKSVSEQSQFDIFTNWIVPIGQEGIDDLRKAIEKAMEEEIPRSCHGCGAGFTKKAQIFVKLPPVLVVVINRFIKTQVNGIDKNTAPVNYPMRLGLKEGSVETGKTISYLLQGVACHIGRTVRHGHYVAMCKHLEEGSWYKFDDSTVYEINEEEVLKQREDAYVLFYSLEE